VARHLEISEPFFHKCPHLVLGKSIVTSFDERKANLADTDLSGADLRKSRLTKANVSEADMRGADLRKANVRGTDLKAAKGVKSP